MEQVDCKHIQSTWLESDGVDMLWCFDCERAIAFNCDACCGEGFVYEDDYEGDWINCVHVLITCPRCQGTGTIQGD